MQLITHSQFNNAILGMYAYIERSVKVFYTQFKSTPSGIQRQQNLTKGLSWKL